LNSRLKYQPARKTGRQKDTPPMVGGSLFALKRYNPFAKCHRYKSILSAFCQTGCRFFYWDIHYPIYCFKGITFFRECSEKESNKET